MTLTPVAEKFILHWGEMGARWGVNRTVAQIHALLLMSPRPLHAEQIAAALSVARSNVSTSLRELQGWQIIRVVHVLGDRRDHFEPVTDDMWEMFQIILDQRRQREIDPTLTILRQCVMEADDAGSEDPRVRKRLGDLLDLVETTTAWYQHARRLPRGGFIKLAKAGRRLPKFLGLAS